MANPFAGDNGLQKLGLLLSGIASTTSRDPRYLQTNLAMMDEFRAMKEREQQEAEQAKQETLLRRLANPSSMDMIGTPATKQFSLNGRTVGQDAPGSMAPVMDDQMRLRNLQRAMPKQFMAAELERLLAGPAKPVALGERDRLVDPSTGRVILDAPQAQPKLETIFDRQGREIKAFIQPDGSYKPVGNAKAADTSNVAQWRPMTDAEKRERNLDANAPYKIDGRTGNYELVSTGTKFNNDQNKAAGYANTMADAEARLGEIGTTDAGGKFKQYIPTSPMAALGGISNVTSSKEYQQYKQGAMDWTLALLRHESGANVPDTEAEKYWTTYFPQLGDSDAVIKQKADARASKMRGVVASSGGAFESVRKMAPAEAAAPRNERPKDAPENARQAKNGKWYAPDPLRPGKYVEY